MSWRRFVQRNRWDAERARELDAYLAIETDDNLARGMAPAEARLAAQRKLGNRRREHRSEPSPPTHRQAPRHPAT